MPALVLFILSATIAQSTSLNHLLAASDKSCSNNPEILKHSEGNSEFCWESTSIRANRCSVWAFYNDSVKSPTMHILSNISHCDISQYSAAARIKYGTGDMLMWPETERCIILPNGDMYTDSSVYINYRPHLADVMIAKNKSTIDMVLMTLTIYEWPFLLDKGLFKDFQGVNQFVLRVARGEAESIGFRDIINELHKLVQFLDAVGLIPTWLRIYDTRGELVHSLSDLNAHRLVSSLDMTFVREERVVRVSRMRKVIYAVKTFFGVNTTGEKSLVTDRKHSIRQSRKGGSGQIVTTIESFLGMNKTDRHVGPAGADLPLAVNKSGQAIGTKTKGGGSRRVSKTCQIVHNRQVTAVLSRSYPTFEGYIPLINRTKSIFACPWSKKFDHVVFHDGGITRAAQAYIKDAVANPFLLFHNISALFQRRYAYPIGKATIYSDKHKCPPFLDEKKSEGYYVMCSFWYSDFLDTLCGQNYDYMLRIDDDNLVTTCTDPTMPPSVPFASPATTGMDFPWVIQGMNDFMRKLRREDKSRELGLIWPKWTWNSPYTSVMWLNLKYLRQSKHYNFIRHRVEQSKCIFSARWGDLPLWGATAQLMNISLNSTFVPLSYDHGSLRHKIYPGKYVVVEQFDF